MSSQDFEQQITFYHNVFVYCAIAALIFLLIAIALFFVLKIPRVFGEMTGRDARRAIDEMMEENATSGSLTSMKLGEDGRRRRRGKTGALSTGRLRKNTGRLGKNTGGSGTGNTSGHAPSSQGTQYTSVRFENAPEKQQSAITEPIRPLQGQESPGNMPTDIPDTFGSGQTDILDTFGSEPTDVLDTFGSEPTDILEHYGNAPDMQKSGHMQSATAQKGDRQTGSFGTGAEGSAGNPVYQEPFSETVVLNQTMKPGEDVFVILRSIVEVHTDEVI